MDLALAFGMPVAEIRKTMTEPELHLWAKYAVNPGMPFKRLEIYFAQLALMIARGPIEGASDMTVSDFMLTTQEDNQDTGDIVADAREAFGYAPQKVIDGE